MVLEHAPEQALAVLERDVEERSTIEIEQVEDLVHETGRLLVAELRLEEAEVGPAVVVDGHDLAIDDGLLGLDPASRRAEEPREIGRRVVEVARQDPALAVVDDRFDAEAVPLDLEQPVLVVESLVRERGEHRLDLLGERRRLRSGEVDLRRGGGRLADPDRVAVLLDLVVGATGLDALREVLGVPARLRVRVRLVDEQPLVAVVALEGSTAATPARPDDREAALQLLAVEGELQFAVGDGLAAVQGGRLGLPGAPVPDDHVAGAVLLRRDDSFEIEVFDRVVLDVDGHPPDLGVEAWALGDGPRDEDAVDLEAEVVVEPCRSMPLDDEPPAATAGRGGDVRRRLGRLPEVAFPKVLLEGHRLQCAARVDPELAPFMAEIAWGDRYGMTRATPAPIQPLMRLRVKFLPRIGARVAITFPG